MLHPKEALIKGAHILESVLGPKGFQFHFRGEGKGSGGNFAWGEFVRGERKLELHFRFSLGLVSYHVADQGASHGAYMAELGVSDKCRYPGVSEDPEAAFSDLAHDLAFADDFVSGSAEVLLAAAAKEAITSAKQHAELMAHYVGDVKNLEQLRIRFHEGSYREVIKLAEDLKYPGRMTESERRMVELARKRKRSWLQNLLRL